MNAPPAPHIPYPLRTCQDLLATWCAPGRLWSPLPYPAHPGSALATTSPAGFWPAPKRETRTP